MISLRPYQNEGIAAVVDAIKAGHRAILLVQPTGSGKTTSAAEIITRTVNKGRRALFIAHRKELVEQAEARLRTFGILPGIVMAGYAEHSRRPVQVASVQTLIKRTPPRADVVIVDEAHHSTSASFMKLIEHYKKSVVIGLTATPYRMDGQGLGAIYSELCAPVSIGSLTADGYLVPARYFGSVKAAARANLRVQAGEFKTSDAAAAFTKRELYAGLIDHYRRFADGTKAIVFNTCVEHSQQVTDAFNAAGIPAAHLDGETPSDVRKQTLLQFAAGRFQVLCNVSLFTEGFDLPSVETVILNRPTRSRSLYMQMVGRALRPAPGKTHARIIDMGGNTGEFGPVDVAETYSLDSTAPGKGAGLGTGVAPVKECPHCGEMVMVATKFCTGCGSDLTIYGEARLAVDVFDELIANGGAFLPATFKAPKPLLPAHLRKAWTEMSEEELREVQALRGYKPGWVNYQMGRVGAAVQ